MKPLAGISIHSFKRNSDVSVTMLAALWLSLVASINAFPTNTTDKIFKRTDDRVLIGYRAVDDVCRSRVS